jgi:hypothetical protein
VADAAREWLKSPAFKAAYDALDEEFALAQARIEACADTARQ